MGRGGKSRASVVANSDFSHFIGGAFRMMIRVFTEGTAENKDAAVGSLGLVGEHALGAVEMTGISPAKASF